MEVVEYRASSSTKEKERRAPSPADLFNTDPEETKLEGWQVEVKRKAAKTKTK
jgi:hypothetical protein